MAKFGADFNAGRPTDADFVRHPSAPQLATEIRTLKGRIKDFWGAMFNLESGDFKDSVIPAAALTDYPTTPSPDSLGLFYRTVTVDKRGFISKGSTENSLNAPRTFRAFFTANGGFIETPDQGVLRQPAPPVSSLPSKLIHFNPTGRVSAYDFVVPDKVLFLKVLAVGGGTTPVKATAATASVAAFAGPSILSGSSVSITPKSASVATGATVQFHAHDNSLSGGPSNNNCFYSVNGIAGGNANVGTIDNFGIYTAPSKVPSPSVVTISATSYTTADVDSALVTVTASGSPTPGPITVTPSGPLTIPAGTAPAAQTKFIAVVTSPVPGSTVYWDVDGVNGGGADKGSITASSKITAAGTFEATYTSPTTMPATRSFKITARSSQYPSASTDVTVTLGEPQYTPGSALSDTGIQAVSARVPVTPGDKWSVFVGQADCLSLLLGPDYANYVLSDGRRKPWTELIFAPGRYLRSPISNYGRNGTTNGITPQPGMVLIEWYA